jgi:tetratricopeptide (TPR) repeat protein
VLERGYVDDGLEPGRKLEICEHVSLILDVDRRRCAGFIFGKLSVFDFEAPASSVVWSGPRFDVPALGVEQGTVGLVAATARLVLGELRTPDRVVFDAAVRTEDSIEALTLWEACLDEGNELARYALGYTLLALGRAREAHEQLKRYSSLVRRNAWAWCYLGQACEQLEDWEGAEYAYRQALESTDAGSFDTDADERLAALLHRLAPLRPELSP